MPRKPDPAIVELALDLIRGGSSFADAGEALDISEACVRNWCKKAGVESHAAQGLPAVTPIPEHMRPAAPVAVTPISTADPIAMVEQMIRELHAQIQADKAVGMRGSAVSSSLATLQKWTQTLKQLRKDAQADADTLHFSRQQIDAARVKIRERQEAIASRGELRCAECSRRLSVQFGTGGADPGK